MDPDAFLIKIGPPGWNHIATIYQMICANLPNGCSNLPIAN